jgi:hypothetical protein
MNLINLLKEIYIVTISWRKNEKEKKKEKELSFFQVVDKAQEAF